MKNHVIVNKETGVVECMFKWGKDRDYPFDTMPLEITQELVTVDDELTTVDDSSIYDKKLKKFYILDITDNEDIIKSKTKQLEEMEGELSEFQEATWEALMIDETKLPKIWQDRLLQKRTLREDIKKIKLKK